MEVTSTPALNELVSVIIPAYNAEHTIAATLESVRGQTYRNLEIIVVNDGSRDHTASLVESFCLRDERIRLVHKANGGLAAARNTAIDHARGTLIAPVDADDLWHPTKLEKQLAVMHGSGRRTGVVYCWARAIGGTGSVYFDCPAFSFRGDIFAPLIFWNFIQSGSVLFRRDLAVAVGGYDSTLARRGAAATCEDLKFYLDLAERCDFDLVPQFLVGYRLGHGTLSTNTAEMLSSRSFILEQAQLKHPELPPHLFRWGLAVAWRESSRIYLQRGHVSAALSVLLKAAIKDPVGALSPDVARIVLGGTLARFGVRDRLKNLLTRMQCAKRVHTSIRGQPFLDVDPQRHMAPPKMRWAPKRIKRIGGMRIARIQSLM